MSDRRRGYRFLLHLLPRDFRERNGREMEGLLADQLRGRSRAGRWKVWAGAVWDIAKGAVELRLRGRRGRKPGSSGRSGRFPSTRGLGEDLGFAVRTLQRRPGMIAVVVSVLAVGIGGATTVFSVMNAVLLRPLPYEASDRIGILWHDLGAGAQSLPALNPLDLYDYREWSEVFEAFTLAVGSERILGGEGDAEVVDVGFIEAGFFDFFGVEPIHGRGLVREDEQPGAAPVAVLSHRLWVRRHGGDPNIVGRTVELGGERHRVVGVLPAAFRLHLPAEAFLLRDSEVWVAARVDPATLPPRNYTAFTAFGRIRPGATFDAAQSDLDRMEARLKEEHAVHAAADLQVRVVPLHEDVVKGARLTVLLLFAAVVLVLVVACANAANLLLARGQSRESEFAIRTALGAGRSRIVRLVFLESVLLTALAGGAGVLLTAFALEVVRLLGRASLPRLDALAVDGSVVAFAVGAATLCALAAGLGPALRAVSGAAGPFPGGAGRVASARRDSHFRDGLVLAEVASTFVLLVGAGLIIRSFAALHEVDPGFDAKGVLTFRVTLPDASFPDRERELLFYERLEERLSALSGVERVSAVSQLPLTGSGRLMPYAYDAVTATNWESATADRRWVAPGFFGSMGATLVAGREFTWQDVEADREVIVIDDRLAARAFPGFDAVGQRLQIRPNDAPESQRWAEIVGVVAHLRLHDLARPHLTQIYVPMGGEDQLNIVLRASVPPEALGPAIRREVGMLGSGIALEDIRTMESLVGEALAPVRATLLVMGAFGVVALAMAAVGIYAVFAFAVRRRSREIGIRLAIGQAPRDIRWMILGRGMRIVLAGILLGGLAAVALGRFAGSVLYGVGPIDPATWLGAVGVLATAALMACWIPARRATRIDPAATLRTE